MTRYRAREGASIPMPDRPGQIVPTVDPGTAVNELLPYYARLIADGDLIPVDDEAPAAPADEPAAKSTRKP